MTTELKKPAFGQPCNSCGLCCRIELCPLGRFVFKQVKGPCPGLTPENKCSLVTDGDKYGKRHRDAAHHLIGAGDGCDAFDETTDDPMVRSYLRLRWYIESNSPEGLLKTAQAKTVWGAR